VIDQLPGLWAQV